MEIKEIKDSVFKNLDNRNPIWGAVLIIIGLAVGFLVWGNSADRMFSRDDAHRMEDGSMMRDDDMNDMDMAMDDMLEEISDKEGDAFDQAFINEMIVHHEGAIAMAKLALERSNKPELLRLAGEIIAAQTREIEMMKQWKTK